MIALLIPVKDFSKAKNRLSVLLSEAERALLARTMLEDVAGSVCGSARVAAGKEVRVVLVSNSDEAIERAALWGWEVLREDQPSSESASVDWASSYLAAKGYRGVLRLPADIPLISADDLDDLLIAAAGGTPVLMVPSSDGRGTNALLRCPPDLFPSRFGPGSFALHLQEAHRAGAAVRVVHSPRIALDVDESADLLKILDQPKDNRTIRLLRQWKIDERIHAVEGF